MNREQLLVAPQSASRSLKRYIIGFVSSLYLTGMAYVLAIRHNLSLKELAGALVGLALVQCVVQLLFFLHVGTETKPRWKMAVFWCMLLIIGIVVVGSLWIMTSLNYRMSSEQVNKYLQSQDGL